MTITASLGLPFTVYVNFRRFYVHKELVPQLYDGRCEMLQLGSNMAPCTKNCLRDAEFHQVHHTII
jgi:hypothetical protein